jgi:thiol-disulfide isomerase/thioredoxin
MRTVERGIGVALCAGGLFVAALFATPAAAEDPAGSRNLLAVGAFTNFTLLDEPRPVPQIAFTDGAGAARGLGEFKGRVVLLNLWATWCAPCRREMPALDRLQARLGGNGFEVVALAVDRGGMDKVRGFLEEVGIEYLAPYLDRTAKSMRALGVIGLPTTLLIDRRGREVGRLIGPAEWDSDEAVALIERFIGAALDEPSQARSSPTPPPPS